MRQKLSSIPICLVTVLLPLAVHLTVEKTDFMEYPWFPNQEYWADAFLAVRSGLVVLLASGMAVILLCAVCRKKIRRPGKGFLFPAALGGWFILSACLSRYPVYSFGGIMEQRESLWVLLGYLVIGYYSYIYVSETEDVRTVIRAVAAGAALPCLLGLTQLFQCDFWASDAGKMLMAPEYTDAFRDSLRFNFSEGMWGRVYMAFYNPDYAGIYLVMVLPLLFLLKGKKRILFILLDLLCLAGTFSKTAWIAGGSVVCVFLFLRGGHKKRKLVLGGAVLVAVGIGLAWGVAYGTVKTGSALEVVSGKEDYVEIQYNGETVWLRAVKTEDGGVKQDVRYAGEEGQKVELKWSDERGECDPLDPALEGLHFRAYGKDGVSYAAFRYHGLDFRFTKDLGNGGYTYITMNGKPDDIKDAASLDFMPDEMMNGRGYIWNRTLPLLFENPWFGSGPDTFMLVFPQDDYAARANLGYGFFTEILTNPHSLYLQTALQTGIPSLVILGICVFLYLKKSWKLYAGKKEHNEMETAGTALALGCLAYLICGLTWSSSVCTTPVFCVLFGAGVGVNEMLDKYMT